MGPEQGDGKPEGSHQETDQDQDGHGTSDPRPDGATNRGGVGLDLVEVFLEECRARGLSPAPFVSGPSSGLQERGSMYAVERSWGPVIGDLSPHLAQVHQVPQSARDLG